jgi:hypothetical protein
MLGNAALIVFQPRSHEHVLASRHWREAAGFPPTRSFLLIIGMTPPPCRFRREPEPQCRRRQWRSGQNAFMEDAQRPRAPNRVEPGQVGPGHSALGSAEERVG